jgi:3-hydroxyisobutyrate dehydrogenase
MIAFLGTGLLGSGFVRALRRRGAAVRVWNRTPEKARALEADGAVACADPLDAVRDAERVHLCLSDDAAVDAVLERIAPGLAPGAVLVDHTTTSPDGAAARAARWAARGHPYQHAPVFMGPQQALEATGVMMVSGDPARIAALAPELRQMTGKLVELGPDPARAAGMKLLGNLFLIAVTTGLIDLLTLARQLGIPQADAAGLLDFFNPGTSLPARMQRILRCDHQKPSWELALARTDARLWVAGARGAPRPLTVVQAVAGEFDRWIAEGAGHLDWTVIGRDVVK